MKYLVFITLLVSIASLCADDNQIDSLRIYNISPIKVFADKPGQSIGNMLLINSDKSELNSPMNLREVLDGVLGLSASTGTKDESNIRIRGFNKSQVKVYLDGVPINGGYFGNVDLNNLPISDIKDILIVKGASSSLFGSGTLGGTINLVSRSPQTDRWLRFGLQFKRNNTNQIELNLSHDYGKWSYSIYGSRSHTDGFVLPNDFKPTAFENGGPRNNSRKTAFNLRNKLDFEFLDFHKLSISYNHTIQNEKRLPSSIYEYRFRKYKNWYKSQLSISAESVLSDNIALYNTIYSDNTSDRYQEYNDPDYQVLYLDSTMNGSNLGLSTRLNYQTNLLLDYTFGLRFERMLNERKDNGNYLNWTDDYVYNYGIFGQLDQSITNQLTGHYSLGLSSFYVEGRSEPNDLYLEPSIALSAKLKDGLSFNLSSGINSANPTMRQLFSITQGNRNLKVEKAWKNELSITKNVSLGFLSLMITDSAFINDINNLIDLQSGTFRNIQRMMTYGNEISLYLKYGSIVELEFEYAYLKHQEHQDNVITESPEHSSVITLRFFPIKNLKCSYTTRFIGERFSEDHNYIMHTLPNEFIHNININYRWNDIKLWAGIENLYDEYYELEYGFPNAGFDFNFGVEVEI